jgi:hypothetical protein
MARCISENKLNGELLAQMIDNAYDRDVKQWVERSRKRLGAAH